MTEENASSEVQEATEEVSAASNGDQVSHDSFQKLMNQHKRSKSRSLELQQEKESLMEELGKFRNRDKEVATKKLEEQGEYEKIMQALKNENKSLSDQIMLEKTSRTDRLKRDSFLNSLPGPLHNEDYIKLANLNNIAVDPETGDIDSLTVKEAVDSFVSLHPALIKFKQAENAKKTEQLSNQAPKPINLQHLDKNSNQLSALEQYKQLLINENK